MPWNCCGEELHDDERSCPACGTTKQRWTVQFDRTRVFSLGPKDWDLEELDYTPDSEAIGLGVEEQPEQEEEEWDLEEVDYLPGDTPGPPAEVESVPEPSTREEEEDEEDWELETIDAPSAGSEAGPAGEVGGPSGPSTREEEEQEDEDWEVELVEQASE